MTTDQINQDESRFEELEQALKRLTTDQIRFVVARQEFSTDKEAAEAIGIKPDTVYQWTHRDVPIGVAVRLMALDCVVVASTLRRRHLAKAMAVKVAGLDEEKPEVRQKVATEIIEWEMGKPTQRTENKTEHSGKLQTEDVNSDQHNRAISTLAQALGAILPGPGTGGDGDMDAPE